MEQRLSLITLGVTDLAKSEEFYLKVFGWKKREGSSEQICFFELNGILLSIYPKQKLAEDAESGSAIQVENQFPGFTLAFCTRSEDEVDELFALFKDNEVRIVKSPEKAFWGGYSGYIADPDGYLWEIAFNPFIKISEAGNVE